MKITTHNNLVKVAADWKDWAVPVGSGLLAYLAGRGLGLGQVGSIMLGAAGATGGHFARKNWDKWFPSKAVVPPAPTNPSPFEKAEAERRANEAKTPIFQRVYRNVPGMTAAEDLKRAADEDLKKRFNELRDSILQTQENEQPPISQEEAEAEANAMRKSEANSTAPTNLSPFERQYRNWRRSRNPLSPKFPAVR